MSTTISLSDALGNTVDITPLGCIITPAQHTPVFAEWEHMGDAAYMSTVLGGVTVNTFKSLVEMLVQALAHRSALTAVAKAIE